MTNLNRKISQQPNQIKIRKHNIIISVLICFLYFSCEKNAIYDQYQAIDNTSWEKDKEYYFTFDVSDISIPYNVSLEIRNNNLYPYQNLWIFCNEEQPIGPLQRDTIECLLADDFGKWYGSGISLFQSSFPIRKNHLFPHKGQYTFSFRQGMRDNSLPGIQEIGLRVEKTK
jgi:gliding motility-associated lipoprotein GldH